MTPRPSLTPEVLVAAAQLLAARLGPGGRLLVHGEGPAGPDADHVVVEFMHPVTVGKRALRALRWVGPEQPDDVTLSIAYGGSPMRHRADVVIADRPPDRVDRPPIWIPLSAERPARSKVDAVLAYHVLWELVHLFLEEQPGTSAATSSAAALYPMIFDGGEDRRAAAIVAAEASAAGKLTESAEVRDAARADNGDGVARAVELLAAAGTVFTFGNGGSSTDAAAAAASLGRGAFCLTGDVATITALANDVDFDVVFARQLATLGRPGDCAVAFSTSGNSPNLLRAAEVARRDGLSTIGFAGYDGGAVASSGAFDVALVVGSSSVHRIQEAQSALVDDIVSGVACVLSATADGDT